MIYDPDRPLYRQFGVSASAAGLQPGQRRSAVFTSVDLRQTTVSAQAQASKANSPTNPSSSAYHSPNTDSEREGESTGSTRPSTWARCASGRDMREDLILSGSESGKRRKNGTASRKKHRRKKRSAKGVEGREARQGSVSLPGSSVMKSMMPLEPSLVSEGSHLLQGIAADSHGCRTQKGKDDDECTDRDAELDDLLNYEINLSCLDLDLDLADCLSIDSDLVSDDSCDSRGQGLVEEIGWRVVSEDADEVISDCETLPPGSGGASPHSIHTPRVRLEHDLQTAGPLLSTDGTDTTSRIENFRPFTLQAMMKKPVKRLNFIAAPAKTPESRQWLSSLDSSGQINFDATPDFIYDHGKKRSYRSVQNNPMSTSTAKKVQGSGRASTLPPWGSAGAKRRNAPSSSASATRSNQQSDSSEVSTPLEVIYCSAAADSENFDFNPQIFSADPAIAVPLDISAALSTKKNSRLYESFKVITSQSKPPSPDLGFTNDGAYLALGISRSGSPESLIVLDKPSGPGSSASSLFTPEYEQRGFNFEERRGQVVRSSSEVCETGDKSFESGFQDVPMRSVDSLVSSQGRQTESTSVFSFSTFSMHSMQSAVKHLFAAPSKSTEYSEKNSKSLLGEGQLESKRADEKQRVSEIVEEPERSGDVIIPSSPRCLSTPVNVPSSSSSSAMHQDSESRRRSKILKIDSASVTPARKLNITPGDDHSQRIFSNTFTTQSPKMDRRISREEELADSEIEAEIDNFIVPDELSPVALRQHGVVMNTREVNGIRQNALMSLPALLDEIGRVSMGNSEDADEDGIEEMSETELGLWGDEAEADAEGDQEEAPDCGNDFIRSQVMAGGEERDGTDNIERLIPDDMDPTPTTRGALMRAQSDAKGEAKFGETCRDVVYWTEDSEAVAEGDVAPADTNTDTDSEGSTYASKKPLKPSLPCSTPPKAADPVVVLTPEEAQELILFREARLALLALETGALRVNKDLATKLLLKLAEDPNAVTEPLETLVLLVDKLGADVNATGCDSMTPLHSLFSNPALGRFILSRGGDVLSKDHYGDSVLSLCAEYGYSWVLPAFISMHGREAKLLEDPVRAHEYAVILLALWGFGARVKELVDEGIVSFSADEALELLDNCAYNFGNMKEPVETFELLESLILKG